jgi:molybdopterin-binding protein
MSYGLKCGKVIMKGCTISVAVPLGQVVVSFPMDPSSDNLSLQVGTDISTAIFDCQKWQ